MLTDKDTLQEQTIDTVELEKMHKAIASLEEQLSFLQSLTPQEREAYPTMGIGTQNYVNKAMNLAAKHSDLVPPQLDMSDFHDDLKLMGQLQQLLQPLKKLTQKLSDTIMAEGSDSYRAALQFHQGVRRAYNIDKVGAEAVLEELDEQFPGRGAQKLPKKK